MTAVKESSQHRPHPTPRTQNGWHYENAVFRGKLRDARIQGKLRDALGEAVVDVEVEPRQSVLSVEDALALGFLAQLRAYNIGVRGTEAQQPLRDQARAHAIEQANEFLRNANARWAEEHHEE